LGRERTPLRKGPKRFKPAFQTSLLGFMNRPPTIWDVWHEKFLNPQQTPSLNIEF